MELPAPQGLGIERQVLAARLNRSESCRSGSALTGWPTPGVDFSAPCGGQPAGGRRSHQRRIETLLPPPKTGFQPNFFLEQRPKLIFRIPKFFGRPARKPEERLGQ